MEKPSVSSFRRHHRKPSFSSTLLDHIYHSIDDSSPPLEPTRKHQQSLHQNLETSPDDKLIFHRRSVAADFERSRRTTTTTTTDSVFLRYSSDSSSVSSSSSSSSSSFHRRSKSSSSPPQPKPIRTSLDTSLQRPNTKQELGGFHRTKTKALKIYTDLKKVKQPISPGGRLATFLNSLFTNASTKPKKNTTSTSSSVSTTSTTCSSASSFSRSCLSKTPSSSGKSKRSVRFCPVNVILDQDSSSSIHIPNNDATKRYRHVREEENRRVIEAAKDLIRSYQKNKDLLAVTTCDDDDDDDDAASCASSDLFELENLSAIGIDRYREELPVYETTRLDNSNRAIDTRLIV